MTNPPIFFSTTTAPPGPTTGPLQWTPHWSEEQIVHEGDFFFEGLLRDIQSATKTIDLETYIFENDKIGQAVASALENAALRGLKVRVLVDGVGSPGWSFHFGNRLAVAGVETQVYHPLWALSEINRRNHRKTCIIDGHIAWVGSMNISACHSQKISGAKAWRDTAIRVKGTAVSMLVAAYQIGWKGLKPLRRGFSTDQSPVRLNYNLSLRRLFFKDLVLRIGSAKKRVWMTTPYFIPRPALLYAVSQTAFCGVDVRLLVPQKSDLFFMRWAIPTFYFVLLKAGVRVFEYLPRVLHAKIMIVDDWATIGSSNLNHRSLIHDNEVDLVVSTPLSIEGLAQQHQLDLTQAKEVTLEDLKDQPWYFKLVARFILLFKHFI